MEEMTVTRIIALLGLLTIGLCTESQADWGSQLVPRPPNAFGFGDTVALSRDGQTALVAAWAEPCAAGSLCGAAYVYVRDGADWRLQARLVASDAASGKFFGGFSFDDNTIALSADGQIAFIALHAFGAELGAVYVFTRNGDEWRERQKLVRPDLGDAEPFGFGRSVAASDSGNVVVIGDTNDVFGRPGNKRSAAYIFKRNNDSWQFSARLEGSRAAGATDSRFGSSVGISADGRRIIVGSKGSRTDLTEAYIFTEQGGRWRERAILTPADRSTATGFGQSVALSGNGNTAVVGWAGGAAYVFRERGRSGTSWVQEAKLGSNITNRGALGFSVDIDDAGDTVVAGAWRAGAAYVFQRSPQPSPALIKWVPELLPSPRSSSIGSSVAISGDGASVLVGFTAQGVFSVESGQ
jgi:hypothetical protein